MLGFEEEALRLRAQTAVAKEAQKAKVILLSSYGRTVSEISQTLGFHQTNIKKWIRSFNDMGLAGIAAKPGLHLATDRSVPVALVEAGSEGELRVVRGFNL